ncbi:restriction endonuclease subunit S [Enterococcus mundtii]|uniref:restriction endonuclease subunit S n=1 Tax=Enterococcus mundtii TaxID=53346 RepID=UPI001FBA35AB|nr:restriction endonuclease subunit S [Enterococcus mundtii]GKS56321.1 type I restriction-modification system specificity subunit S [Enterococcus mundtii]
MSNDTQPEIRFPGFTEDWEQRKLSELATMNARIGWQNLRTSEFLDKGDYMLITGTDFKDGAIDYSNIHYVERERFEQDKKIQISNGSILITKDGTLGKVAYVEGLTMPATLNAGVFNVRVKENLAIDSRYLFHYLKAPFLLKFADQRSTGGTIKHLNQNVLVEFPIPLPSLEEQHKVAGLLSNFDNTIALHQRKLDLLKETKKGFLQKMFPKNGAKVPEIRFPGFTGDWEQRKLGEVSPLRGGFAFKSNKFVKEGIPIVRISNILSNGSVGGEFVYYTAQEKDENYLLPDKSALLAMSGATTGKVSILNNPNNNKVYQNQRVGYFTKTKNVDYSFISTLVRSKIFLDQLNSVLVAGAQPNISSKDINVFELTIPKNIEEQKKIGNFFKQLDDTITLHQRKLDLLKEMKKGFLQKMFV